MTGAHEAADGDSSAAAATAVADTGANTGANGSASGQRDDANRRLVVMMLAGMVAAVFWLVVLTFPDFFFINPFTPPELIRKVNLVVSTVGWVAIATVPSVMLVLYATGRRHAIDWMPVPALLWPVSIVLSQVTVLALGGSWYLDYLGRHPVLIFTDVILPVALMVLWLRLRVRR